MTGYTCPNCQADLEPDLVASTGTAECPFCGADVSALFTQQAAAPVAAAEAAGADFGLPPESRVSVVEFSDRRKVLYIPPGGKRVRGIGFFAFFWLALTAALTTIFTLVGFEQGDAPLLFVIPFFSLFWAVGLGILYCWIRMRFSRFFLLLERDRLAVQRVLFGRRSVKEALFDSSTQARLSEAYRENHRPVYAVAVNGTNRTVKFGTALSREEKDWLVGTINDHLGIVATGSVRCGSCGHEFTPALRGVAGGTITCPECGHRMAADEAASRVEQAVEPMRPEALRADSPVRVAEASHDRLRFSLPAAPRSALRTFAGGFFILFALIWMGATGATAVNAFADQSGLFEIVFAVVAGAMSLVGLVPLAFGLFAFRGRITVAITPQVLDCRWHLGPVGYTKRLQAAAVDSVVLGSGVAAGRGTSARPRSAGGSDVKVCLVRTGRSTLPLTTFHEIGTAREVAGLVKGQLDRMGVGAQDA